MKQKIIVMLLVSLLIILTDVFVVSNRNYSVEQKNTEREELVIYSSHPLEFITPLIEEFESQTGIHISVESGGSGELINKIEAEQQSPIADVLWGGSLSTLKPQMYLFEKYISENEEVVQKEFRNKEGMLTRFSDVPSIIMVNKDLIGNIKINGYQDLLNPNLKGKIAYCSPAVSSSAYEHLINMLYAMGNGVPEAGWSYIEKLCENLDGNLLKSSTEVYEGVKNGEYVVGLTFEEAAAALVANGENIKIVYMKEGVVSTPDCICIVKNTPNMENAQSFINFVTGYEVQTMITARLNRRSVRTDVKLPKYLLEKSEITILHADGNLVDAKKKDWIQKFKEIFLHINKG